jgi:hypothetical protein
MMKKILHFMGIITWLLAITRPGLALAESGLPNSAEFGYGVRLDLSGEQINASIAAAASLKINWLAIDFDWANVWPTKDSSPDLEPLNQAMLLAQQNHLSVMISIIRPPAWVVSAEGPDLKMTVQVVKYLARTYPEVLLAIELFPGANTIQGWGTTPNPNGYLTMLQATTEALQSIGSPITMIAGGLTPLASNPPAGDIDDLVYLDKLYNAGAQAWMPVISIRLTETTGDPMFSPTQDEKRCLRHFEEIRQVMVIHDHRQGLLWLTGFSWPAGNLQASDTIYQSISEQTRWLNQAYQILKAQLFFGVAFFSQINPPGPRAVSTNPVSLIRQDLSIHPAFANLGQLISPPADNTQLSVQTILIKRIVQDVQFKPSTRNASIGQ